VVNGVYKLVATRRSGEWHGVWKRSADKATVPGPKQVFRTYEDGTIAGDVIGATDERLDGEPLLRPAMRGGEPTVSQSLDQIRDRTAAQLASLPAALRRPGGKQPYPVRYSERLSTAARAD
jgi:nicotinate phosphoribosyltransferase